MAKITKGTASRSLPRWHGLEPPGFRWQKILAGCTVTQTTGPLKSHVFEMGKNGMKFDPINFLKKNGVHCVIAKNLWGHGWITEPVKSVYELRPLISSAMLGTKEGRRLAVNQPISKIVGVFSPTHLKNMHKSNCEWFQGSGSKILETST